MNIPNDDPVAVLRERIGAKVAEIKADLEPWIARHSGPERDEPDDAFPDNYVEISIALLETGIDRYIHLHGPTDGLELIISAFRRQARKFRQ